MMAVWWMKEHPAPTGAAAHINSPQRDGELITSKVSPTQKAAQQLFNSTRAKLDKANYVQVRAPDLARAL